MGATERVEESIPLERAQYLDTRQRMLEGKQRAQQRLDQLVVGGASGALVLSVTFLEKIAPSPVASTRWLLADGWILLLVALLTALLSHATAARSFEECMNHLDSCYENNSTWSLGRTRSASATEWLNRATILAFILGMTALVRFAFVNVNFKEERDVRSIRQTSTNSAPAVTPGTSTARDGHQGRDSIPSTRAAKAVTSPRP